MVGMVGVVGVIGKVSLLGQRRVYMGILHRRGKIQGEMGRGGKSKNAASSVFLIWKRVDFILSDSLVFRGIFSFFSGRLFLRPGRRWGRFQGSGRFR